MGRLTFEIQITDSRHLPPFLGSALRGSLGISLKKLFHADTFSTRLNAYTYLFETPSPPSPKAFYSAPYAPHPFVLDLPLSYRNTSSPQGTITFSILLLGEGLRYKEEVIQAVEQISSLGLGSQKSPFQIKTVTDSFFGNESSPPKAAPHLLKAKEVNALELIECSAPPRRYAHLRFETPLRLVEKKKVLQKPCFRSFLRSLLARLSALFYFHCGVEVDLQFKEILQKAEKLQTTYESWRVYNLQRWSNRQKCQIPLDGVLGEVSWEGDLVEELWSWFLLGQWVHVGKSTSMGLGRYRLLEIEK
jgi:CRISPR/Cas system endoribonuclease Cas6 (RAMP superfamily)